MATMGDPQPANLLRQRLDIRAKDLANPNHPDYDKWLEWLEHQIGITTGLANVKISPVQPVIQRNCGHESVKDPLQLPEHCPYQMEINDDPMWRCLCCDTCRDNCADDI